MTTTRTPDQRVLGRPNLRGALLPPYVIAAEARKAAKRPRGHGAAPAKPGWEPVGIRHAAASRPDPEITTRQALCGASLAGWLIFATVAFDGSNGADCQRCEQVMRRRASKPQERDEPA